MDESVALKADQMTLALASTRRNRGLMRGNRRYEIAVRYHNEAACGSIPFDCSIL